MQKALAILQHGGVIIHATETCYGIACDVTNEQAVEKLFTIKQRPFDKPVSALFSSVEQAKDYVLWTDRAEELAAKFLPGPLTLILALRDDAPERLFLGPETSKTVGVRISSHPWAHELSQVFGKPLSTTSANIHGQPEPYCLEDIERQFATTEFQPDLIIDSGILPKQLPSTIVEVLGDEVRVVRQGTIVL